MVTVRFKSWMREAKWTTVALGERLDVDPSYLSHLRAGRHLPSLRVAVAIERLSADWPHGPIRPDEWLRPAITTDAPAEPAPSAA